MDDLDKDLKRWEDVMRARGHTPVMDGESLDFFAAGLGGRHNGPRCVRCDWKCCMHCNPDPEQVVPHACSSGFLHPDDLVIGALYRCVDTGDTFQLINIAAWDSTKEGVAIYSARYGSKVGVWACFTADFCDGRFELVDMTP